MKPTIIKDLGLLYPSEKSNRKRRYVIFECQECFEHFKARKDKNSSFCPKCTRDGLNSTHNKHNTRLYKIFHGMKARCYNKNKDSYNDYGGRGIIICKEWLNDFLLFYNWSIENGYKDTLSIDRKENNGNYEPDNCRWTNQFVQSSNIRKIQKNNTSGYKGVFLNGSKINPFSARIQVKLRRITIGRFPDKIQCAKAYDLYIIQNNLPHTLNFT